MFGRTLDHNSRRSNVLITHANPSPFAHKTRWKTRWHKLTFKTHPFESTWTKNVEFRFSRTCAQSASDICFDETWFTNGKLRECEVCTSKTDNAVAIKRVGQEKHRFNTVYCHRRALGSRLVTKQFPLPSWLWPVILPVATASRSIPSSCNFILFNPSRSSWSSIHQDALDRFMCPKLCDPHDAVCGADCGAAASSKKKFHCFFLLWSSLWLLCCVMLATSSSLSFTPLTYLAGLFWVFLLALALLSYLSSAVSVQSFSSRVHLPGSFAALIHDLLNWLLLSGEFSVSFSSSLRVSLMSSSHLLLGLPIALLVLYFELSQGFHSAAFTNHLSLGIDATYSQRQSPFHSFMSLVPTSNLRIIHLSMASSVLLLCIQSTLLLQSLLCQILRRYRFREEISLSWSLCVFELCPSSLASPVLPRSSVSFSRWSRLFVSRSFCIFFVFVWWVEAFWVATIESFFRALLWVTMFQMRSSSSRLSQRRKAEIDVWAWSFSMLAPVCTCGTLPKQPWFDFWFRSCPAVRKLLSGPSILYFLLLLMFRLYVINLNFFSDVQALIAESFRISWMDPESHFFRTSLEFAQDFLELFFWVCK